MNVRGTLYPVTRRPTALTLSVAMIVLVVMGTLETEESALLMVS